ncbi:MAG: hypothetical protein O3A28_10480, partial [Actinomycetota bacterium]|nr:hypothetical protein [Actinomycetota bacterium]
MASSVPTTLGAPSSSGSSTAIRAAVLAGFVGGWDATALYFIFPAIRDDIAGGDAAAASWVLSITSIVAAAVMLQAGRVGDR